MKKMIAFLLTTVLLICSLAGFSFAAEPNSDDDHQIQIVATIFPEYDWVMNVLGENPANAEVTFLLSNGVDIHSYQPTVDDILKISTCDLFIYAGGESDAWVNDALQQAVNPDRITINLLETMGDAAKEEELVEGMQAEEHEHEEDHEHEHEGEEDVEYDEHVWLSLRNASTLVGAISDALQVIDPENAEIYAANAEAYETELNALDDAYEAAVDAAARDTLLFGDRFPFRYLTDDYGLNYYAAFVGCSAETEASFETITFLIDKVNELELPVILTIDGSDQKIAETIVQNTETKDQNILTMNSMQSITTQDIQDGKTYLSIMEDNLTVLKEALE